MVVKKNKPIYAGLIWGSNRNDLSTGAAGKATNFVKNTYTDKGKTVGVVSTLIYGVQWDSTIKFFNGVTGPGNYSNELIKTGTDEKYKIKNIYDMAGNAREWTMEAHYYNLNESRYLRGRSAINNDSVWTRQTMICSEGRGTIDLGFRVALYLK